MDVLFALAIGLSLLGVGMAIGAYFLADALAKWTVGGDDDDDAYDGADSVAVGC